MIRAFKRQQHNLRFLGLVIALAALLVPLLAQAAGASPQVISSSDGQGEALRGAPQFMDMNDYGMLFGANGNCTTSGIFWAPYYLGAVGATSGALFQVQVTFDPEPTDSTNSAYAWAPNDPAARTYVGYASPIGPDDLGLVGWYGQRNTNGLPLDDGYLWPTSNYSGSVNPTNEIALAFQFDDIEPPSTHPYGVQTLSITYSDDDGNGPDTVYLMSGGSGSTPGNFNGVDDSYTPGYGWWNGVSEPDPTVQDTASPTLNSATWATNADVYSPSATDDNEYWTANPSPTLQVRAHASCDAYSVGPGDYIGDNSTNSNVPDNQNWSSSVQSNGVTPVNSSGPPTAAYDDDGWTGSANARGVWPDEVLDGSGNYYDANAYWRWWDMAAGANICNANSYGSSGPPQSYDVGAEDGVAAASVSCYESELRYDGIGTGLTTSGAAGGSNTAYQPVGVQLPSSINSQLLGGSCGSYTTGSECEYYLGGGESLVPGYSNAVNGADGRLVNPDALLNPTQPVLDTPECNTGSSTSSTYKISSAPTEGYDSYSSSGPAGSIKSAACSVLWFWPGSVTLPDTKSTLNGAYLPTSFETGHNGEVITAVSANATPTADPGNATWMIAGADGEAGTTNAGTDGSGNSLIGYGENDPYSASWSGSLPSCSACSATPLQVKDPQRGYWQVGLPLSNLSDKSSNTIEYSALDPTALAWMNSWVGGTGGVPGGIDGSLSVQTQPLDSDAYNNGSLANQLAYDGAAPTISWNAPITSPVSAGDADTTSLVGSTVASEPNGYTTPGIADVVYVICPKTACADNLANAGGIPSSPYTAATPVNADGTTVLQGIPPSGSLGSTGDSSCANTIGGELTVSTACDSSWSIPGTAGFTDGVTYDVWPIVYDALGQVAVGSIQTVTPYEPGGCVAGCAPPNTLPPSTTPQGNAGYVS